MATTIVGMVGPDLANSPESDDVEDLLSKTLRSQTSTVKPRRTPLGVLLWVLASVPTAALLLLLSMALRVWVGDGVWPQRNAPDPKDLGIHNTITVVTILGSFAAVLLVPVFALISTRFSRGRTPLGPLLLGLTGFAVLFVVLRADLAGLGDWIGD